MNINSDLKAIIWDYDGTLMDTRQKNLNVTKKLIKNISGMNADKFPILRDVEKYHQATMKTSNWRKLYQEVFLLSEEQINEAGSLWTDYQISDNTPVTVFDGIKRGISALWNIPQGIVSQNSKSNVISQLEKEDLIKYFGFIVGYEEVEIDKQKPEPDGLINCIEELIDSKSGVIFYIGDHETDIQCAMNANRILQETELKIYSIGAFYGSDIDKSDWRVQPDYEAHKVQDVFNIINEF